MLKKLEGIANEASDCTRCGLAAGRTQVVFGSGSPVADLMFIGEAPGAEEDRQGFPFVGRSGNLLDRLLSEELGIERSTCYIANVVKCRPPENRNPKSDEIIACKPWLDYQLDLVSPKVIVTLGNFASKLLLNTDTGITRLRDRSYDFFGRHLVPTFHPAAALRGGASVLACMRSDLIRAKHLIEDL